MLRFRLSALFLFCFSVLTLSLYAQVNTASLTGRVADPSGTAIASVPVSVTNTGTGLVRNATTDSAGYYSFQDLPIGEYKVVITQSGFDTAQETLQLTTAQKARRDFSLHIGSTQQTVQVSAEGNDLSPDDASIGSTIERKTIEETPLYLRNWDDLLRMVPGVQISRFTQQSGNTSAGRTGDFNVHGVQSLQNDFILDGIDNNTISENVQELSTEASHPSVDAIQEFRIITNPYSAEYGRAPGAAVSVSTKSGTNQIHGLVYEYLRNQYFDANDFFSDQHHLTKPENNQNQFGANLGAPIIRNHLFAFFNYEGTRIHQGVSRIATVPLPNERAGDFSPAASAANGITYAPIYDPTTGQQFQNNTIPATRIDPVVSQLMQLFPQPNIPGAGEFNNFTRNALSLDNNDSYDARVDWTASQKDNVFVRYSYFTRYRFIPGYFGGIADGTSTSAWGRQFLSGHSAVIGWTHVFTPSLVNDFHLGFIRDYSFATQDPFGLNAADQYLPGVPNNPATAGGVPLTQFANYTFIGSPDFLPKSQVPTQYEWTDSVAWTRGAHSLKFGATLMAPMRNIFQDEPGTRGDLNFTGNFTCQRNASNACVSGTGLSYADGLIGYVQSTQLTNVHFVDQRLWMASGFVEDDWKATPRLTLNLGLRYDFATPALNGANQQANFDPAGNGGAGSMVLAGSGGLYSRSLVHPNYKDFGPRFGFAFSADKNTVIRGGYGIYYTLFERDGSEDQLSLNPPFLINKTPAVPSSSLTPVLYARNGFPSNFLDPSTINLNQLQAFHVRAVNPHQPSTSVQQWSLGFQRQIGPNWLAEVNYVGTKSTHLDVLSDYNQPIIQNNKSTGVIPYTNFGYIEYLNPIAYGSYNGLEASLIHHYQNGLSLRAAYTYSRSLDNAPEELESSSGSAPNGRDYAAWYGPSDFDVPHRVALSGVYELPFGHDKPMLNHGPLSWIFGNFRTSEVYTYYSGHPFTVNAGGTLQTTLDAYGQATATPNLIGRPKIVGDPSCWFYFSQNKSCGQRSPGTSDAYALPAPGEIGDSGRNTLRGPHTTVLDASLLREFPIRERANVEFRWEVFNVTNTPEFGQPNGAVTTSSAGSITTLSGDPRVMQFALRVSY